MLKLGFDLDGVVFDSTPEFLAEGVKLGLIPPETKPEDITQYDIGVQFGLEPKVAATMWAPQVCARAKPYPQAEYVLHELEGLGAEFVFITARSAGSDCEEEAISRTKEQLNRYGWLRKGELFSCCSTKKAELVCELGLVTYLDDCIVPVNDLCDRGFPGVWLMDRPWNKKGAERLPRTNWDGYLSSVLLLLKYMRKR